LTVFLFAEKPLMMPAALFVPIPAAGAACMIWVSELVFIFYFCNLIKTSGSWGALWKFM
jgi:hypothetical protein